MLTALFPPDVGDVITWMLLSAVVGLCIYGLLEALRQNRRSETDSDTSDSSDPHTRRKRRSKRGPMDASGWTLFVDGSNFARHNDDGADNARLNDLDVVLDKLRSRFRNADIVVYCDANLRYLFDDEDRAAFERRLDTRQYVVTHDEKADHPMLRNAREMSKCIVVSNDKFSDEPEADLRIGVPLLKVRISRCRVRLLSAVEIYQNRHFKRNVPVEEIVRSSSEAA